MKSVIITLGCFTLVGFGFFAGWTIRGVYDQPLLQTARGLHKLKEDGISIKPQLSPFPPYVTPRRDRYRR